MAHCFTLYTNDPINLTGPVREWPRAHQVRLSSKMFGNLSLSTRSNNLASFILTLNISYLLQRLAFLSKLLKFLQVEIDHYTLDILEVEDIFEDLREENSECYDPELLEKLDMLLEARDELIRDRKLFDLERNFLRLAWSTWVS